MRFALARNTGLLACAALAAALLAGCDRGDGRTPGQKLDAAIDTTRDAAQRAGSEARAAADNVAAEAKARAPEVRREAQAVGETVRATLDDAGITAKVVAALQREPELSTVKLNVDTNNGQVTLRGPAGSAAAKERATAAAMSVDGVRGVDNQLTVDTVR